MNPIRLISRACGAALLLCTPIALPATQSSGDSAIGMLETVPPSTGVLVVPETITTSPFFFSYSGVGDAHSALTMVELMFRTATTPWESSGFGNTEESGEIPFVPPNNEPAVYFFQLVATDTLGNVSTIPTGLDGEGQGSATFAGLSNVSDWWLLR